MISKEVGIALGTAALLVVGGGVAWAATRSPSSTPAQTPPTSVPVTAGHRYQVTVTWTSGAPDSAITGSAAGIQTFAAGQLATLSPNPFSLNDASFGTVGGLPTAKLWLDCTTTTTVSTTTLAYLVGASTPSVSFTVTVEDLSSSSSVSGHSYSAADAIPSPLGTSITVGVGSSLQVTNPADALWQTPGVTTNSAVVVTPSIPATTNGFVAVAPGTAILTGSYVDPTTGLTMTGTVVVTVVSAGAGAISSSGGTAGAVAASSSSGSSSTPPSATTAVGAPSASGWTTTITLGTKDATVSAWAGDTVVIQLPAGGTWASSGQAQGLPTSGSAPYSGTWQSTSPFSVTIAWVFGGATYSTKLSFIIARSWTPATSWQTGDTVRISLTPAQIASMQASFSAPGAADEVASIQAYIAAHPLPTGSTTADLVETTAKILLTQGPWATQYFAPKLNSLSVWYGTDAPPSDWPSSDTTGALRAEWVYTGPGIAVSALPFGVTSWVRAT